MESDCGEVGVVCSNGGVACNGVGGVSVNVGVAGEAERGLVGRGTHSTLVEQGEREERIAGERETDNNKFIKITTHIHRIAYFYILLADGSY